MTEKKRINLVLEEEIMFLVDRGIKEYGYDDAPSAIRGAIRIAYAKDAIAETQGVSQQEKKSEDIKLPVRKYSPEVVDEILSRTSLSKSLCPKCTAEFNRDMTTNECSCLKSEGGRLALLMWLKKQYE